MSKTNPILNLQCILQGRQMSIWFISLEANLAPVKTQKEYLFKLHEKVGVPSTRNELSRSIHFFSKSRKEGSTEEPQELTGNPLKHWFSRNFPPAPPLFFQEMSSQVLIANTSDTCSSKSILSNFYSKKMDKTKPRGLLISIKILLGIKFLGFIIFCAHFMVSVPQLAFSGVV